MRQKVKGGVLTTQQERKYGPEVFWVPGIVTAMPLYLLACVVHGLSLHVIMIKLTNLFRTEEAAALAE